MSAMVIARTADVLNSVRSDMFVDNCRFAAKTITAPCYIALLKKCELFCWRRCSSKVRLQTVISCGVASDILICL